MQVLAASVVAVPEVPVLPLLLFSLAVLAMRVRFGRAWVLER